jgi:hypothetical protein
MKLSRSLDAARYELRLLGPLLFAVPLLVASGFVGFAILLDIKHIDRGFIAMLLSALFEACLPLAAGVIITTLAVRDTALELLLTLRVPYRFTALRRFSLVAGWTLVIEAAAMLAVRVALPWALPRTDAAGLLIWLAPTLWFAGAGALLALLLRSRSVSASVLGCVWVTQLVFHGYFASYGWTIPWFLFATLFTPTASYWTANRVELLLGAMALFLAVWGYLHNAEWRFHGEDA